MKSEQKHQTGTTPPVRTIKLDTLLSSQKTPAHRHHAHRRTGDRGFVLCQSSTPDQVRGNSPMLSGPVPEVNPRPAHISTVHRARRDLRGGVAFGRRLRSGEAVPVCRAATLATKETVHLAGRGLTQGSPVDVRAAQPSSIRTPATLRLPRRTTSQRPSRRSSAPGTHCSSATFTLFT